MADELKIRITAEDGASKTFKAISDGATTMGDALEKAGAEGTKGLDQLDKSAQSSAKSMASFKADAVAIGATMGAVAGGIAKAGEAYRDQQRQVDGIRRAYGEASDQMLKFAEHIQDTTRFSNDAARQSEQLASSLTKNYQLTADQMEQLISRSADLAQIFGIDLADAVQRTSSALRGEGESAEALALNMSDAAIAAAALQAGLTNWNVPGAMSEAEKAAFRFQVFMEQSAYATGAAADAADNAGGMFRQLVNELQDAGQAAGGFLGPIAQVAAELAPLALLAPVVGAGFGIISDNWSKMTPRGKGIVGALAAVSVAIPIGVALWEEYDNTVNAIPKTYDKLEDAERDYFMRGDAIRSTSLASIINYSEQAGAAYKLAAPGEFGPNFPAPSDSAWAEMMTNIANNLSSGKVDVVEYTDFVNSRFAEIAQRPQDVISIMDEINGVDMTRFALGVDSADNALKRVVVTAEQVKAATVDLTTTLDDLRIGGRNDLASQFEQARDVFGSVGTEQQQAIARNRDYWESLTGPDKEAAIAAISRNYSISAKTADDLAVAQERVLSVMESGNIQNDKLLADLQAIDAQKKAGLITDEEAAAQYIKISENLSQYVDKFKDMKRAQAEWLANGRNFLDWWQEYDTALARTRKGMADTATDMEKVNAALAQQKTFRLDVEIASGVQDASEALDQVLRTFGEIDALGQRSAASGSIADNLIGAPGELGALQDLWDRIAQGTSDAALSQEVYNQAIESGIAIQESNVRVQDDLNVIRAKQIPLLQQEQEAYEANIERIANLNAEEGRRVLLLQDSAVQSQVAALYSQAYAASIGEIPKEAATKMILESAEADAGLKDLLLNLGLISEDEHGIRVNFPDAESVGSSIDRVTKALLYMQGIAEHKTAFEIAVELYGEEEADRLFNRVDAADGKTATMNVTVLSTGVDEAGNKVQTLKLADGTTVTVLVGVEGLGDLTKADSDLKAVQLADGTVVTVKTDVDTTGWDQSTVGDLINNGTSVEVETVLKPPTGWTTGDWNNSEGPLPSIEVDTKAKPLNETPEYTGGPVDVPVTFAANATVGDGTGGPLAGMSGLEQQEFLVTLGLVDNASQGISDVQSALTNLPADTPITVSADTSFAVSSVNAVTESIALVPKDTPVTVTAETGAAVDNVLAVSNAIAGVDSKTVYLDVVTRYSTIGSPSGAGGNFQRHGGVPAYATGGVLFEAGEAGAELAHFAGGGTALIPNHGLYVAQPNTYIEPANSVATKLSPGMGMGGPTIEVHIHGNVYGIDDLTTQIMRAVVPALVQVTDEQRRGMGV